MYGLDLGSIFVPGSGLTPKIVLAYISELHFTSRYGSAVRGGPQFRNWDETRYATVAMVEAIRALTFTYIQSHTKKSLPAPQPYPTPDRTTRQTRQANTPGSFASIAAGHLTKVRQRKAQS